MSVNIVITKTNPFQNDLTDFHMAAIGMAVERLYTSTYFSICEVNEIASILGIRDQIYDTIDYKALRLMHCIHWDKMGPRLKQQTLDNSLRILGINLEYGDQYVSSVTSNSSTLSKAVRTADDITDVDVSEVKPAKPKFIAQLTNIFKK